MMLVMRRMTAKKRKNQREHPHQSLVPRQTFLTFDAALKRADGPFRKPKMKPNK
jgi:hypothetical protein